LTDFCSQKWFCPAISFACNIILHVNLLLESFYLLKILQQNPLGIFKDLSTHRDRHLKATMFYTMLYYGYDYYYKGFTSLTPLTLCDQRSGGLSTCAAALPAVFLIDKGTYKASITIELTSYYNIFPRRVDMSWPIVKITCRIFITPW
jgi:hypothetical protein